MQVKRLTSYRQFPEIYITGARKRSLKRDLFSCFQTRLNLSQFYSILVCGLSFLNGMNLIYKRNTFGLDAA